MARMYSRKHGKHGSTKPLRKGKPSWVKYGKKEVEEIVIKLAKEGKSSSEIGAILRDEYGIPDVKKITKKSITKIMKEKNFYPEIPEDLYNLIKKAVKARGHLLSHRRDSKTIHGLELIESKIRRLGKFYIKKGVFSKDWKYDPEKAKLLVKG